MHRIARPNILAVVFYCLLLIATPQMALAADANDAATFASADAHVLFLSSDAVEALELSRNEARKYGVDFKKVTRYTVLFKQETIIVFLGPPYTGGLDGPSFSVIIRRSDFRILSVKDQLER